MKFTTGSKTLLEKLQFVGTAIPAKSTMAILDNFLFDIDKTVLGIMATDLEMTISTSLDIESDGKAKIAIPAKMLIEILKAFPDQPLEFDVKDNSTIEISSISGNYSIAFHDGEQYPTLPEMENTSRVTIPAQVLSTAISKTLFATGTDELRPVMSGVFFEFRNDGLNFVATDAHKLARYSRTDIKCETEVEFVVPKKPLGALKSMLAGDTSDTEIEYNTSNATFYLNGYVISCRLVDAKFPNYRAVIPPENPNVLLVDRVKLLNSLKCVSIFSNSSTRQVRFSMKGAEMHIHAEDIDYSNKADEHIPCNYEGEDMMIGFNSKFLIEMLGILHSENVKLEMSLPNRAGILTPADALEDGEEVFMLCMPTVINK